MELEIITQDVSETQALGRKIGKTLSTGMTISLSGDLGSGKTAFVQGLAQGLSVPESHYITSPTYTLINEYSGRLPLFHIDLYRISSAEAAEEVGFYDVLQPENVVAIEWPQIIASELPTDSITIHFEIQGEYRRKILIRAYGLMGKSVLQRLDIYPAIDKKR